MFPKKGNKLHGQRQTTETGLNFNQAIAAALRREVGATHQAAKSVMRWTGASERTAKHWLSGVHGPSGMYLVQLMQHSDEVLRTVLILADRAVMLSSAKTTQARIHLMAAIRCLERED
jgi:hypothetical protein